MLIFSNFNFVDCIWLSQLSNRDRQRMLTDENLCRYRFLEVHFNCSLEIKYLIKDQSFFSLTTYQNKIVCEFACRYVTKITAVVNRSLNSAMIELLVKLFKLNPKVVVYGLGKKDVKKLEVLAIEGLNDRLPDNNAKK
jgi:hypothetical protein